MPGPFGKAHQTGRAGEDDWYIPYRPGAKGPNYSQGIGNTPSAPPKSSSSAHLFRSFSTRQSRAYPHSAARRGVLDKDYEFPPIAGATSIPRQGPPRGSRPFPALYDPLHGSVTDERLNNGRLHSSTSVPSGLVEPKILYSPMIRELRAHQYEPPRSAVPHSRFAAAVPVDPPRQRTVSAPNASLRRPYDSQHPRASQQKDSHRGWAPLTMCDMLVFPRPSLRPHSFTPPHVRSDPLSESDTVIGDGEKRQHEREAWHSYTQRSRSRSFGSNGARAAMAGQGQPVLTEKQRRSNSLARSRSGGSGSRRRGRGGSVASKASQADSKAHSLSAFLSGRRGSRHSDAGRTSLGGRNNRRPYVAENQHGTSSTNPLTTETLPRRNSHAAVSNPPPESTALNKQRSRSVSHLQPTSGVLDMADYPHIPPRRSSRIVQVRDAPQMDKNGVIIIPKSSDALTQYEGGDTTTPRTRQISDRFKPLPAPPTALPIPAVLNIPAQVFTSFTDAGSSFHESHPTAQTVVTPAKPRQSVSSTASGGSAGAQLYLSKQHQRAQTRKAFETPAGPPPARSRPAAQTPLTFPQRESTVSRYSQLTAPASATLPLSFHQRRSAASTISSRNRAASVGDLQGRAESQHAHLHTRYFTDEGRRERTVSSGSRSSYEAGASHKYSRPPTPLSPALPHPIELIPPNPPRIAVWDSPPRRVAGESQSSSGADKVQLQSAAIPQPTADIGPSTGVHHEDPAALGSLHHTPSSLRPDFPHTDTSLSRTTIYTDASEGWDRSQQPTPTPAPTHLPGIETPTPLPDSASYRVNSDEPNFSGLFFRTPRTPIDHDERSAPFSAPTYPSQLDRYGQTGLSNHSQTEQFLGLELFKDPLRAPHAALQHTFEQDQRRDSIGKSSSGASTAEVITPSFPQEASFGERATAHQAHSGHSDQVRAPSNESGAGPLGPAFDVRQREAPLNVPSAVEESNRISALISTASTAGATPAIGNTPSMHKDTPIRYARVRSGFGAVTSDDEEDISPRRQSHVPLFELSGSDSPVLAHISPGKTFGLGILSDAETPGAELTTPAQHGRNLSAVTEVTTPVSPYSQMSFRRSMIDAFPTPPGDSSGVPAEDLSEMASDYTGSVHKRTSYLRMGSEDTGNERPAMEG